MGIDCLSMGILFADVACAPVERLPEVGELLPTDRMQLGLGGCAANAALNLARVGVHVGVAGCVGDDPFGRFIVDALSVDRIDAGAVHRVEGIGSGSTMVINVEGQDRRFISTAAANTKFTVAHVPVDWVRQAKVLYLGGFFMMPGLETDACIELFRSARASGTKTVLDVALYGEASYWDRIAPILSETDVVLPNDFEAALMTGQDDPLDQAQHFLDAGARSVAITCGEKGTYLVADNLRLHAGVYPTEFVGGTGAGDAFDAGFIAGILADEDPAGCLRWGSALGASCVRSIGATESVFNRAEAEAFMREHVLEIEEL